MSRPPLERIIEALLMASPRPLPLARLQELAADEGSEPVERKPVEEAIASLQQACVGRSLELVEVGNGWRYQVANGYGEWVSRLWEERPARYSRALLETLALIAYRQPITRAEIEEIRGVAVSTQIIRSLLEREWVRVVGHRELPGRPAMYATTRNFLDYFGLSGLAELPSLAELRDLDQIEADLRAAEAAEAAAGAESSAERPASEEVDQDER
jgi:segregation and condensation protein B